MTGPTHIAAGVVATLVLGDKMGISPDRWGWIAVLVGSLAPDIDAGNATISRPGALFSRFLPRALQWPIDLLGTAFSRLVRSVFGHRKAVHWPVVGLSLIVAGIAVETDWLAWFGWGYLVHILADACTKGGIQLLAPIVMKEIRWSPVKTKSRAERVIFIALASYICAWAWTGLPPEIIREIEDLESGALAERVRNR